ncbi:MAG: hypothetical protein WAV76_15715, partial [Bacteroidota bacterium]
MANWITDAELIHTLSAKNVAMTQAIENFILGQGHDQFIIVAAKGMGKTLLLRHKRKVIEESNVGILLIPQNSTADYVSLPASLPKEIIELMNTLVFWEDVWKLAISISMLLYFPHKINSDERDSVMAELARADLPDILFEDLKNAFYGQYRTERNPSGVLDIILQSSRKNIEKLRASGLQIISGLFSKYISSACFVFIDSFDHALSSSFPNQLHLWCSAQCGLLKAAWELSRHNSHVNIFVTIRQEAYADFSNTEKINIKGSVLL